MFTRPLALKLLAPTVLVSLALIAACGLGAWHLNKLHENVSAEILENVNSTLAAEKLELATRNLIKLLSDAKLPRESLVQQVPDINNNLLSFLASSENLANLPEERKFVGMIGQGLRDYLHDWDARAGIASKELLDYDHRLASELEAGVLGPCNELRRFNLKQIERSAIDNQTLISRLTWGIAAVGLGAPLSGILLGYAVARSLGRSIYQLSVAIRDAAGRLNCEVGPVMLQEGGDLPELHRQMQGVLTEIERVVEQLQQKDRELLRAEQLSAVGQVAASVAHELRNPLTSVKMLVQTGLEGQTPLGLPTEDLRIIEDEVRRMEERIQVFLDFAKPPRSERRRADLIALLRGSLALIEGRARKQKVTIDADLPAEPLNLLIDTEQLNQVFVNLLLNALDALPRGGAIAVRLARGRTKEETARNGVPGSPAATGEVTVRVVDSGPGIAPRIHERLFQPFVTSKETGVGLGLSICKRLIEAHGGTIRGANRPEGGAEFVFTLPS